MDLQMTKFNLFHEVQKNYKGALSIDKALILFDMENGYTPEIIEEKVDNYAVSQAIIDIINEKEGTYLTVEQMVWMKQMQEKGTINMIIGDIRNVTQTTFVIPYNDAASIHRCYMAYYKELYCPEELV